MFSATAYREYSQVYPYYAVKFGTFRLETCERAHIWVQERFLYLIYLEILDPCRLLVASNPLEGNLTVLCRQEPSSERGVRQPDRQSDPDSTGQASHKDEDHLPAGKSQVS
jgi:hypothetical protein